MNPLHFTELHVRTAPGCIGSWRLRELSAGVNIVFGPNASGKTTTARALAAVLWPNCALQRDEITASFNFEGAFWHAEVHGKHTHYQRNNADSLRPSLPAAEAFHGRCNVALHDLLQIDDSDIGKWILRVAAGGCDLDAAAKAMGCDPDPRLAHNAREVQAFKAARAEVEKIRKEGAALDKESARLAQLNKDLQNAKLAHNQAILIGDAIKYRRNLNIYSETESKFQQVDQRLAKLAGNELEQIISKENTLEVLRLKQNETFLRIENARAQIQSCGLPEEGVAMDTLVSLSTRVDGLRDIETELARLKRELAAASERAKNAQQTLSLVRDNVALELPQMNELAEFARDWDKHCNADAAARNRRELLGHPAAAADLGALRTAELVLAKWLRTPAATGKAEPPWQRRALLAIAALVGIGSLTLALTATAAAWVGLVPMAALIVIAFWRHAVSEDSPEMIFPNELAPPSEWETSAVQQRLQEIQKQLADAEHAVRTQRDIEAIELELKRVDARGIELNAQRAELCARLGCELDPGLFKNFVEEVGKWRDARNSASQSSAQIESCEQQLAGALEVMAKCLAPFGAEGPMDYAAAHGIVRDLETRANQWSKACQDLRADECVQAQFSEQRTLIEKEIADVLKRVGVATAEELDALMRGLDDYTTARNTEIEHRGLRDQALAFFEKHSELENRELGALEGERDQAAMHGGQVEALIKEKQSIETMIGEVKRKTALEEAVAKRDKSKLELLDLRSKKLEALTSQLIIEHVKQEMGALAMPPVFARAAEFFRKFTLKRFDLVPPAGDGGFRARDKTAGGAARTLAELSSGTRVQLLLAVRAAFVANEEAPFNVQLPLLLDETLANSDDRRAQQIIEAVAALAREGRQIFYFTAQADEVTKWCQYFAECKDVPHRTFDLAAEHAAEPATFERIAVRPAIATASPGTLSYEEYRSTLAVPDFDPRADIGTAHLWHVCEDTATLHRLLQMDLESWGQLDGELRYNGDAISDIVSRLRANAELLTELGHCWRHGRGRPLDRNALVEGGVTDRFIECIWEIACREGRDAARVINAIERREARGFRDAACERLREYFEEHGYLAREAPLDGATIRARLQLRGAKLGVEPERVDSLFAKICHLG